MTISRQHQLAWIFRVALAMCFVGHGAFGILTKPEWLPFFGLAGIPSETAYALMPLIGTLDIALGIFVLFRPVRAAVLYMAVWALWTASLRPLSGDSVFEMFERAGNYGVPLAFLLLLGIPRGVRAWFTSAERDEPTPRTELHIRWVLAATSALLLVGHGALAVSQKAVLVHHAAVVGFSAQSLVIIGAFEIAAALVVLLAPRPGILCAVAAWKVATELLYPLAGAPVWEFIERGGSYAAPLILALLATRRATTPSVATPRLAGLAAVAALLMSALTPTSLYAQQKDSVPVAPPGILDSLRRGGYAIACRHGATNHDQSDRGPAREQQRNLSAEGEEQSRSIGSLISALRIPIGEVRANPMYRNRETAEYMFGKVIPDSTLSRDGGLRRFLTQPSERGSNRAAVVRQGTIYDTFREWGVKNTAEGDCFIVQPVDSTKFHVLARLRVTDWSVGGGRL